MSDFWESQSRNDTVTSMPLPMRPVSSWDLAADSTVGVAASPRQKGLNPWGILTFWNSTWTTTCGDIIVYVLFSSLEANNISCRAMVQWSSPPTLCLTDTDQGRAMRWHCLGPTSSQRTGQIQSPKRERGKDSSCSQLFTKILLHAKPLRALFYCNAICSHYTLWILLLINVRLAQCHKMENYNSRH